MDKALLLVFGGLLTAFALIPDQSGPQVAVDAPPPDVSREPKTAQSVPAYVAMPASPTSEPETATARRTEPHPARAPVDYSDANAHYHAARTAKRARINAEEIARQTPIS